MTEVEKIGSRWFKTVEETTHLLPLSSHLVYTIGNSNVFMKKRIGTQNFQKVECKVINKTLCGQDDENPSVKSANLNKLRGLFRGKRRTNGPCLSVYQACQLPLFNTDHWAALSVPSDHHRI